MKSSWTRTTVLRDFFIAGTLVAFLLIGGWLYGAYRWNNETQELRARLEASRVPIRPKTVDFRELEGLPALQEGDITLTMLFTFDEQGLIHTVHAEARGRAVGGEVVPAPWRGRFWNYEERGGMLVPLDGEVAWLLPEGKKPYWRGHITEISYEFAR